LKRTSPEKLLEAIHEVHGGGVPMTAEMARRVIRHFQSSQPAQQLPGLTPREREVLQQLAKGFRYKEIEENLRMSTGTLRTYVASIYRKLHVHSRTEAVVKYLTP
jgi:DNA-binding NarL/FixJ family response regulator